MSVRVMLKGFETQANVASHVCVRLLRGMLQLGENLGPASRVALGRALGSTSVPFTRGALSKPFPFNSWLSTGLLSAGARTERGPECQLA